LKDSSKTKDITAHFMEIDTWAEESPRPGESSEGEAGSAGEAPLLRVVTHG